MKYKKTLLIIFSIVFSFNALAAITSWAAQMEASPAQDCPNDAICFKPNVKIPGTEFGGDAITITPASLGKYIVAIYKYGAWVAGLVAMFMLVLAGWKWLFAAGNSSQIGAAKEMITGIFIGLILLFGGQLLLSQISVSLVEFKPISGMDPIKGIDSGSAEDPVCEQHIEDLLQEGQELECGNRIVTSTPEGDKYCIYNRPNSKYDNDEKEGVFCLRDVGAEMGSKEKPCPSVSLAAISCKEYKSCTKLNMGDWGDECNTYEIIEECLLNKCRSLGVAAVDATYYFCSVDEGDLDEKCVSIDNVNCETSTWCNQGMSGGYQSCCADITGGWDYCRCVSGDCNKHSDERWGEADNKEWDGSCK